MAVEGFVSDDRREIETIVTLEPESWLKSSSSADSETVRFRVPGGQVGRYRRIVLGAPVFAVGQRVVVFLGGRAPRLPHLVGLSQGVFRIARGAGGDTVLATRSTTATSLAAFETRVRAAESNKSREISSACARFESDTPSKRSGRPSRSSRFSSSSRAASRITTESAVASGSVFARVTVVKSA